ncbi:MAG: sodium/solute symporter [Pontiellaceae bacterium]|nr:sodium/solute symporter [Pontiellaceae bacterium]
MLDIIVFVAFVALVMWVGLSKSKGEDTHGEQGASDYFLAGRGLTWWLIGFSLIAANISAEQFVGMSGQGAGLEGLSVASWEWIAAITLVVVAFVLLPYFLRSGITTIPEFLEIRYNHWARLAMTLSMMLILIGVSLIGVIYAGALTMTELMDLYGINLSLMGCCWALGAMASIYVAVGGLKACAWADLIQGTALIIGGGVITYFAFDALSGTNVQELVTATGGAATVEQGAGVMEKFNVLNDHDMHMGSNPSMPWPILLMGIWIPNFYYWGLNQYITQRILGSASLAEGQKGLVLAGFLKLVIPFVIIIPGLIAFNLFSSNMKANAAQDAASTLAKYAKVNPAAETVEVLKNPSKDVVSGWDSEGVVLIAVYDDAKEAVTVRRENKERPYVVSIEQKDFDKAQSGIDGAVKFSGVDDEAFVKEWPALATEMAAYNATVTADDAAEEKVMAYKYDSALGLLITKLIPQKKGILGFVVAALLGAIVSSLAAVLNAASTLLTMDVYQRYIDPKASQFKLVTMGRIFIGIFVVLGCAVAPMLANNKSIFEFIQKFQGYVSTGILAVFIYGLINRTSGKWAGVIGLIANPIFYGFLTSKMFTESIWPKNAWGDCHYLYSMSFSLILVLFLLSIYGMICKQPKVEFAHNTSMDLTSSKPALMWGIVVCVLTVALYVIFW